MVYYTNFDLNISKVFFNINIVFPPKIIKFCESGYYNLKQYKSFFFNVIGA